MLKISCIIIFTISCHSSALCSNFHALFSQDHCQNNPAALKMVSTLLQSMTIILE